MMEITHLHPMAVHFPIALLMIGFLFELYDLVFRKSTKIPFKAGEILLYLSTFAAIVTVLTGILFTGNFSGKALDVRNIHALFALMTMLSSIVASTFYLCQYKFLDKASSFRRLGFLFYLMAVLAVAFAAFWGGTLVYGYMVH